MTRLTNFFVSAASHITPFLHDGCEAFCNSHVSGQIFMRQHWIGVLRRAGTFSFVLAQNRRQPACQCAPLCLLLAARSPDASAAPIKYVHATPSQAVLCLSQISFYDLTRSCQPWQKSRAPEGSNPRSIFFLHYTRPPRPSKGVHRARSRIQNQALEPY